VNISKKAFCRHPLNGQIESRDIATDSGTLINLVPTDLKRPFVDALDFTSPNAALTKTCPNDGTTNQAEQGFTTPNRSTLSFR
jgi:hypothetical protein